jgi:glyoxylase-like metal-dependent hydrolase (beta-lactamase superfamily II)
MKITEHLFFYPEQGMLDANTYIIKDHINIVVDVGSSQFLPSLIANIKKDGIKPTDINFIINTHLHLDHYMANEEFKKLSGARILAHPAQKKHYDTNVIKVSRTFGISPQEYKEDGLIDNTEFGKGKLKLEIIETPGHSSDGICVYSPVEKFLICGDLIFSENTGRVDLPGGNVELLKKSIDTVANLDIEYLLPGHNDIITGAAAVKDNFKFIRENVFRWL